MTDDIVTRLRGLKTADIFLLCNEAADDIERLWNAIIKIDRAITDEGKVPSYHRAILEKHRGEWPTLHNAIDEARQAVRGD